MSGPDSQTESDAYERTLQVAHVGEKRARNRYDTDRKYKS